MPGPGTHSLARVVRSTTQRGTRFFVTIIAGCAVCALLAIAPLPAYAENIHFDGTDMSLLGSKTVGYTWVNSLFPINSASGNSVSVAGATLKLSTPYSANFFGGLDNSLDTSNNSVIISTGSFTGGVQQRSGFWRV